MYLFLPTQHRLDVRVTDVDRVVRVGVATSAARPDIAAGVVDEDVDAAEPSPAEGESVIKCLYSSERSVVQWRWARNGRLPPGS
jgi:hypothetical protein